MTRLDLTPTELAAIDRALGEDELDPACCPTCAGAVSAASKVAAALAPDPNDNPQRDTPARENSPVPKASYPKEKP